MKVLAVLICRVTAESSKRGLRYTPTALKATEKMQGVAC